MCIRDSTYPIGRNSLKAGRLPKLLRPGMLTLKPCRTLGFAYPWIAYYSHLYRTQLRPTLKRIDAYLIRWARGRYMRMVHQTKEARDWFDRLRRATPKLIAHWPLCHGNDRTSGAV